LPDFPQFQKTAKAAPDASNAPGAAIFYAKIRLFQKYFLLFFRPPPGLREQADTVIYWWTLKKGT